MVGNSRRFSKRHETFDDWNRQAGNSVYVNRIRRLHAQYPNRTLKALKASSLRKVLLPKLKWAALTPKQQDERKKALDVLSKTRRGSDFYAAADNVGIGYEIAMRHLSTIARRGRDNQIAVRPVDSISIGGMVIYTAGQKKSIITNDSRQRSTIGRYHSAVGRFLSDGDYNALSQFIGVTVYDENGVEYELETDPEKIIEIKESEEEAEFFDIYGGGI